MERGLSQTVDYYPVTKQTTVTCYDKQAIAKHSATLH